MNFLRGSVRVVPIFCALAILAAPAPAAEAAPGWSPMTGLSTPGGTAYEAHVAVDSEGDAVAVWQRHEGSSEFVQAATRPVGGAWSAPMNLSQAGSLASLPRVAVDARGDAVAVWQDNLGQGIVQAATLAAGTGAWSAPATISDTAHSAGDPEVVIDAAGDATAIWEGADAAGSRIAQVATMPAGGAWSAPVKLSVEGANAESMTIAFDAAGDTVAAWVRNAGINHVVQTSTRPAGGAWGAPVNLLAPGQNGSPRITLDADGGGVVVWEHFDGTAKRIQAASRVGMGGTWSAPVELTGPGESGVLPEVAVDAAGDAVAAWNGAVGTRHYIGAANLSVGAPAWSAPAAISGTAETALEPTLASDSRGDVVAVWEKWISNGAQVAEAARRPAGASAWESPVDLSDANLENREAAVAIDDWGDAVAVWRGWDGANGIIRAASYTAERPVPVETGGAGEPAVAPASGPGSPSAGSRVRPPRKARCPNRKVLRKVKLPAKGRGAKARTVLRCVKPNPHPMVRHHPRHGNPRQVRR